MENLAPLFKIYQIFPALASAAATTHATGLNVTPGESPTYNAIAIANIGAATGTPDSFTVAIVVEESATVGGTYDTIGTFATATAAAAAHLPITINPAKPFIRASAVVAFVNGTTPKIPVSVSLLMQENVASDSNVVAFT